MSGSIDADIAKMEDLCRLCSKADICLKDLLDYNNQNLLKLVEELVLITVTENDDLPKKICSQCEEKILNFHLFILECNTVQEALKKSIEDALLIKVETEDEIFLPPEIPAVKSENVKDEFTVENEFSSEEFVSEITNDDDFIDNNEFHFDDDSTDLDDKTVATLKKLKQNRNKKIEKVKAAKPLEVNENKALKTNDFVKIVCHVCGESYKSWKGLENHCEFLHNERPVVYCSCGVELKSRGLMYKHVSDHKLEIDKIRGCDENKIKVSHLINFKCMVCKKKFSSFYKLESHCKSAHKLRPVVRCACGVILKSKSIMYKHVADHKDPNVFCCDQCPKIAKSLSVLQKHKLRHLPKDERIFKCSVCEKICNSKDSLKSHLKSHIPIEERKLYECDLCNSKFTTRSSLVSHKRNVHEKIKAYVCDLCGFACATNGELRQHRAIHSDDKPFQCPKCPKTFKTASNMKTHQDTHEDTSYSCYVCNRVLNSRRTLAKHLLVHNTECRHKCSYCNKAFKRRQTLKVHLAIHTGDKPISCKWCDERFAYASTLRSHRLRYHPEKMVVSKRNNVGYMAYNDIDTNQENLKNEVNAPMSKMDTDDLGSKINM